MAFLKDVKTVLDYLGGREEAYSGEIALFTGFSKAKVSRIVSRLRVLGVITEDVRGRNVYIRLNETPEKVIMMFAGEDSEEGHKNKEGSGNEQSSQSSLFDNDGFLKKNVNSDSGVHEVENKIQDAVSKNELESLMKDFKNDVNEDFKKFEKTNSLIMRVISDLDERVERLEKANSE